MSRLPQAEESLRTLVKDYLLPGIRGLLREELNRIDNVEIELKGLYEKIDRLESEINDNRQSIKTLQNKTSDKLARELFGDLFKEKK